MNALTAAAAVGGFAIAALIAGFALVSLLTVAGFMFLNEPREDVTIDED